MGVYLVTCKWAVRLTAGIEVPTRLTDPRRHRGGARRDRQDAAEVAFVSIRSVLAKLCGLVQRDRRGGDACNDLGAQRCGHFRRHSERGGNGSLPRVPAIRNSSEVAQLSAARGWAR